MVLSCCIPLCKNRATKEAREKGVHFHRIPLKKEKRELWLAALKRKGFNPGPNTYICSEHFVGGKSNNNLVYTGVARPVCNKFGTLGKKSDDPHSPAYIPSIFGRNDALKLKASQSERRYQSFKRRQERKEELEAASSSNDSCASGCDDQEVPQPSKPQPSADPFEALQKDYLLRLEEIQVLKHQLELYSGNGYPSQSMLKSSDSELTSFFTGLPSYSVLEAVFNFVSSPFPEGSKKSTKFECFLMTLMKIRLGVANFDLGFRFGVDESQVSRTVNKWLQIMDVRLSPLIHWPEREEVQKTMPWCFQSHYGLQVTSIIDCFELFIEKPGDPLSRAATWSSYKHHNTAKYLISITPQGTINFISKGYGGRASDKYITEDCGYLKKLLPGDVVLADRGFNVQESIAFRGATLNIPAFTKGKPQLPAQDVESTRRLANVRIHVERVIGNMRQKFKILNATTPLPTQYTRSRNGGPIVLDSIVRVSCALHNICDAIIPGN